MWKPAVLVFALVVASPHRAAAFDSFWHSAASEGAAQQHGFNAEMVNLLQFGTFGPDFFGPLYDTIAGERIEHFEAAVRAFLDLAAKASNVRKAGVFMHFDNLYGELDRDWKIDYVFRRLLDNTQHTIASFSIDSRLDEGTRKILVVLALGASLHMVEDFYSHSNWVHFDFVKLGFPQQQSIWHQDYAPSWFQVVAKLGPPSFPGVAETSWTIEARSGVYPPPKSAPPKDAFGVALDHTLMNHDNSQLFYEHASRIAQHGFGAHPAKDQASAAAHQLYAINTAAMAASEWIDLVEQDPGAKSAIEGVHDWQLRKFNPAMLTDLSSALASVLFLSCVAKKWDGDNPPKARATQCSAFNTGIAIPTPFNEYWAAFVDHDVLERLTNGIGDASGHYTFDKDWYGAHRPSK